MKEALATGSGNLIIDVDVVAQYAGSVAVVAYIVPFDATGFARFLLVAQDTFHQRVLLKVF